MKTLLALMCVNNKCYKATKYYINTASTFFMTIYFIDTSGIPPKKVIFSSLRELFTKVHQER